MVCFSAQWRVRATSTFPVAAQDTCVSVYRAACKHAYALQRACCLCTHRYIEAITMRVYLYAVDFIGLSVCQSASRSVSVRQPSSRFRDGSYTTCLMLLIPSMSFYVAMANDFLQVLTGNYIQSKDTARQDDKYACNVMLHTACSPTPAGVNVTISEPPSKEAFALNPSPDCALAPGSFPSP